MFTAKFSCVMHTATNQTTGSTYCPIEPFRICPNTKLFLIVFRFICGRTNYRKSRWFSNRYPLRWKRSTWSSRHRTPLTTDLDVIRGSKPGISNVHTLYCRAAVFSPCRRAVMLVRHIHQYVQRHTRSSRQQIHSWRADDCTQKHL